MGFWGPYGVGDPPMGSLWELNGGVWLFKRGFGVPLLGFGAPGGVLGSLWGFENPPLWGFGGPYGVSGVPMGLGTPNYGVNVEVKLGCVAL